MTETVGVFPPVVDAARVPSSPVPSTETMDPNESAHERCRSDTTSSATTPPPTQPHDWSFASLAALVSFFPHGVPLAFVAATPIARLAAETYRAEENYRWSFHASVPPPEDDGRHSEALPIDPRNGVLAMPDTLSSSHTTEEESALGGSLIRRAPGERDCFEVFEARRVRRAGVQMGRLITVYHDCLGRVPRCTAPRLSAPQTWKMDDVVAKWCEDDDEARLHLPHLSACTRDGPSSSSPPPPQGTAKKEHEREVLGRNEWHPSQVYSSGALRRVLAEEFTPRPLMAMSEVEKGTEDEVLRHYSATLPPTWHHGLSPSTPLTAEWRRAHDGIEEGKVVDPSPATSLPFRDVPPLLSSSLSTTTTTKTPPIRYFSGPNKRSVYVWTDGRLAGGTAHDIIPTTTTTTRDVEDTAAPANEEAALWHLLEASRWWFQRPAVSSLKCVERPARSPRMAEEAEEGKGNGADPHRSTTTSSPPRAAGMAPPLQLLPPPPPLYLHVYGQRASRVAWVCHTLFSLPAASSAPFWCPSPRPAGRSTNRHVGRRRRPSGASNAVEGGGVEGVGRPLLPSSSSFSSSSSSPTAALDAVFGAHRSPWLRSVRLPAVACGASIDASHPPPSSSSSPFPVRLGREEEEEEEEEWGQKKYHHRILEGGAAFPPPPLAPAERLIQRAQRQCGAGGGGHSLEEAYEKAKAEGGVGKQTTTTTTKKKKRKNSGASRDGEEAAKRMTSTAFLAPHPSSSSSSSSASFATGEGARRSGYHAIPPVLEGLWIVGYPHFSMRIAKEAEEEEEKGGWEGTSTPLPFLPSPTAEKSGADPPLSAAAALSHPTPVWCIGKVDPKEGFPSNHPNDPSLSKEVCGVSSSPSPSAAAAFSALSTSFDKEEKEKAKNGNGEVVVGMPPSPSPPRYLRKEWIGRLRLLKLSGVSGDDMGLRYFFGGGEEEENENEVPRRSTPPPHSTIDMPAPSLPTATHATDGSAATSFPLRRPPPFSEGDSPPQKKKDDHPWHATVSPVAGGGGVPSPSSSPSLPEESPSRNIKKETTMEKNGIIRKKIKSGVQGSRSGRSGGTGGGRTVPTPQVLQPVMPFLEVCDLAMNVELTTFPLLKKAVPSPSSSAARAVDTPMPYTSSERNALLLSSSSSSSSFSSLSCASSSSPETASAVWPGVGTVSSAIVPPPSRTRRQTPLTSAAGEVEAALLLSSPVPLTQQVSGSVDAPLPIGLHLLPIVPLRHLRLLSLQGTSVSSPGVLDLIGLSCPLLESLFLGSCPRVCQVESLGCLPLLRQLDLHATGVHDEGLRGFATPFTFPMLEELSLAGCGEVSDISPLGKLKALQQLDLRRVPVRMGWMALKDCPALQRLWFESCSILPWRYQPEWGGGGPRMAETIPKTKGSRIPPLAPPLLSSLSRSLFLSFLHSLSSLTLCNLPFFTAALHLQSLVHARTSLRTLSLRHMPSLTHLTPPLCHLPTLESLYLEDLPGLTAEGLDGLGLALASSLQRCRLIRCPGVWHLDGLWGAKALRWLEYRDGNAAALSPCVWDGLWGTHPRYHEREHLLPSSSVGVGNVMRREEEVEVEASIQQDESDGPYRLEVCLFSSGYHTLDRLPPLSLLPFLRVLDLRGTRIDDKALGHCARKADSDGGPRRWRHRGGGADPIVQHSLTTTTAPPFLSSSSSYYSSSSSSSSLQTLCVSSCVSLTRANALMHLPHLYQLDLSTTSVTDNGIASLAAAPTLHTLLLRHCPQLSFSAPLFALSFPHLEVLHLSDNPHLTTSALRNVFTLVHDDERETCGAGSPPFPEGVVGVHPFPLLRELFLSHTAVDSLQPLRGLCPPPPLRSLDLSFTAVSGEGLKGIRALSYLKRLSVHHTPHFSTSTVIPIDVWEDHIRWREKEERRRRSAAGRAHPSCDDDASRNVATIERHERHAQKKKDEEVEVESPQAAAAGLRASAVEASLVIDPLVVLHHLADPHGRNKKQKKTEEVRDKEWWSTDDDDKDGGDGGGGALIIFSSPSLHVLDLRETNLLSICTPSLSSSSSDGPTLETERGSRTDRDTPSSPFPSPPSSFPSMAYRSSFLSRLPLSSLLRSAIFSNSSIQELYMSSTSPNDIRGRGASSWSGVDPLTASSYISIPTFTLLFPLLMDFRAFPALRRLWVQHVSCPQEKKNGQPARVDVMGRSEMHLYASPYNRPVRAPPRSHHTLPKRVTRDHADDTCEITSTTSARSFLHGKGKENEEEIQFLYSKLDAISAARPLVSIHLGFS